MKRFLKGIILFILIWFVVHEVTIVADGLTDELEKADVGVVLGNKVELDGQPSLRLQSRLDKAVELYNGKYFDLIIVSGGLGVEGFDEAKVMKEYLIKAGIPEDKIIEDNNGNNTEMTARNAKSIMENLGFDSAMIITQYYHVTRTKLVMKEAGINDVYSAHARFFELRDIYSLTREFAAYYKDLLFE